MRILPYVFLLLMGMTWRCVQSTCVFETDFGLSINCGLKKSGLFRVRNLGGVKGYVGLGIQLADELGFKESLSTLEQNSKRRSVNGFPVPGSFEPLQVVKQKNPTTPAENIDNQDRSAYAKMNGRTGGVSTVPPFRPLMAAANNMVRNVRLAAQQQQQQQQHHQQQQQLQQQQQQQQQQLQQQQQQQQQHLLKPLPVPAFAALPESIAKVAVESPQPLPFAGGYRQSSMTGAATSMAGRLSAPQTMQPVAAVALVQSQRQTVPSPIFMLPQQQQQMLSPIFMSQQPQQQPTMIISQQPQQRQTMIVSQQPQQQPTMIVSQQPQQQPTVAKSPQQQPAMIVSQQPQQHLAAIVSQQQPTVIMSQQQQQQQQQQPLSPVYYHNAMQQAANRRFNAFGQSPQNSVDVRPMIVMATAPLAEDRKKQIDSNSPLSNEVDPASMMSLFNVASANNVSVEQLAMALRHRQQQTFYPATTEDVTTPMSTTTVTALPTTTTTPLPPPTLAYIAEEQQMVPKKIAIKPYKSKYASSSNKVMNAPKEYYPVGYDKNFDDNFVSKVDLPDTTFSCGDQKHFPGLYGDEDLGCMVFHVCAFTDDGLTQKSFLCPESTLFDQTILKCNWWFYVDCKSSRKLYDSNIPISKSYQLMKALTFFSSYSAGPSVDASVAAATAAVSPQSSDVPKKSDDLVTVSSQFDSVGSSSVSNTTNSAEVFDNVSFRR